MEIREERNGGILVVEPVGRVDTNTSGELEKRLLGHLQAGETRLVLDLRSVDYVSSAGLRVLLLLVKRLGDRLVLSSMRESVRQVFDLAGFLVLFAVVESREQALVRLQGPA